MATQDNNPGMQHGTEHGIRLAMLGMVDGNAHPYSWSAIVNGFEPAAMERAIGDRYPVILDYLGKQKHEDVQIPGARVTHIWTDDPKEAPQIAAAAGIQHVLHAPEEALGEVDAVIIATDDGNDHLERARPFVAAGLPVFVDKPLATNLPDLRQFISWERAGKPILSSSGLRYSPELAALKEKGLSLNEPRWITSTTVKTWERYGVHALEPAFTLLGPGFTDVTNTASGGANIVTLRHRNGSHATIAVLPGTSGCSGLIHVYGASGYSSTKMTDTYTAFRNQMLAFVKMIRTGRSPFPFSETIEIMLILIAGLRSRDQGGRTVSLDELRAEPAD